MFVKLEILCKIVVKVNVCKCSMYHNAIEFKKDDDRVDGANYPQTSTTSPNFTLSLTLTLTLTPVSYTHLTLPTIYSV